MSTATAIPSLAPQAPPQHDARGRFVKGNKGGPGNPLAGMVNQVRKQFLEYFLQKGAVRYICDYLMRRALNGDASFMRIILQYTIGKLPAAEDFDEPSAGEAEAEALAELAAEIARASADADPPQASVPSPAPAAVPREDKGAAQEPARQAAPQPTAGAGDRPPSAPERAASVEAALTGVPNPPRAKKRERLLKLLGERDPVDGDAWPGSPSTNGLGAARDVPLVGT